MSLASLQIKLVHKILALVLIPFFFNGLLFFWLNDALARKAQMVETERTQAKYLEDLNHGLQLFYDVAAKLFEYELTSDPVAREVGLGEMKELKALAAHMRMGPQVSSQRKEDIESIAALMEQEFVVLPPQEAEIDKPEVTSFIARVTQARRMLRNSLRHSTAILLAIQKRQARLDQVRVDEQKEANSLQMLVIGGFVGNLLLAVGFAYFVVADFSKRLTVLLTNSQRLGKRLPLTAGPALGNDELTALDHTVRTAATDLRAAFEFRASLMEMVAHDLRSPLMASQVSLQRLAEVAQEKLDEQDFRHVERVQASNGRLLALIEDLLTVDRVESGELELDRSALKIRKAAAESVLLLGGLAAASDVRIINRCGDETVMADARRVAQVFNNILSNAIKYSPPNSEIEITSQVDGREVVVSIRDQGIGMSEEESKRVFEKFHQVDNAQKIKGFGLGLAICEMIIAAHRGRIGVESSPSKGARFWFALPKA